MRQNHTRAIFATLMLSICCGVSHAQQRDDGGAERFFGFMDRNRDGRLDAEELQRMPQNFRDSLARQRVDLNRGLSRDEFLRVMPRAMEEARSQREGDRGRDEGRRREDDRSRDDERRREEERRRAEEQNRGRPEQARTAEQKVEYYTPRKITPITIALPNQFSAGDTDGDGQIGYYEWKQWKPEAREEFELRDRNGDGFLTPAELLLPLPQKPVVEVAVAGTQPPPNGTASATTNPPGATAPPNRAPEGMRRPGEAFNRSSGENGNRGPGAAPGSGRDRGNRGRPGADDNRNRGPQSQNTTPAASSTTTVATPSESAPEDRRVSSARLIFTQLDADKDNKISADEWGRSRTIKPRFESAGIDISQPMAQEQFVEAYLKAFAN